MSPQRSLISRLFILGVSAVALSYLDLSPRAGQAAPYDYMAPQVAPAIASDLIMSQIETILNQGVPGYFEAYSQATADGVPAGLAPLKVVQSGEPNCPYLGVFHNFVDPTHFATYLGCSGDLKAWYTAGQIYKPDSTHSTSQPDIRILGDGSVLYADEDKVSRPLVRVLYYGNVNNVPAIRALIANPGLKPTKTFTAPATPGGSADGTPELARISYNGDILSSTIEVTHHYYLNNFFTKRDLQAVGVLTNFSSWSNSVDTGTNNLVTGAGGNGKIGDREEFKVGSQVYEVVEAQVHPSSLNDYGSWRLFLINRTTGAIRQLNPVLFGGTNKSLGNPTVSFLPLPDGTQGLVFTYFIFSQNNGTTPPGGHMFVYSFH